MKNLSTKHYHDIALVIDYLCEHFRAQPELADVAAVLGLSPSYVQKLFTTYVGVSPKQFLKYMSVGHAKGVLAAPSTLLATTLDTGLSTTSRLHDLFVTVEGMTPGAYRSGGAGLTISYSFVTSPYGALIVASTSRGVCHLMFMDSENSGVRRLREHFPHAQIDFKSEGVHQQVQDFFTRGSTGDQPIALHLKGTPFQLKVWEALVSVPPGELTTYGSIAHLVGSPRAHRAVGTAVGHNPISYLIPCHRVIQSSGIIGGYAWGAARKKMMIAAETADRSHDTK